MDDLVGTRITRRTLLGGLGAAAVLAACGDRGAAPPVTGTAGPTGTASAADELNVQVLWPELVLGEDRFLQFVLQGSDQSLVLDADVTVTLENRDGETTIGPLPARFFPDPRIPPQGIYDVVVTVDAPGIYDVRIAAADGRSGTGVVQAMPAEESRVIANGMAFPSVDTPTVDAPQDLDQLCTRQPDCTMHATSLADALGTGAPIVLTIATPAFCTSALCGPVVDDVEDVHVHTDRNDVVFIHCEPFKDAGNTPTAIVDALSLPTEPWTFVLDGDGKIVERFPGPVIPEVLRDVIART